MWKTIENKPNYEVNEIGQVKNKKTGRILKNSTRNDKYQQVMLGRKTIPEYIHRLVAKAFIPNPDNLPQVNHIDGNKENNSVINFPNGFIDDGEFILITAGGGGSIV